MSPLTRDERRVAVVTGASTGIGLELAKLCADKNLDVVIASNEPQIREAAQTIETRGVKALAVETDLSTTAGVDRLYDAVRELACPVEVLIANAGVGLGKAFLDQDFGKIHHVIDTNVTGTVYAIQKFGRDMRDRNAGRILIVGSIAGLMPGAFQAVYNGTKAFLDNFAFALRNELKDTAITVSCLMPGATETEFFRRAGMMDTRVGQEKRRVRQDVARDGFDAMMQGDAEVVSGWGNKIRATLARVTPPTVLAEQHRKMAEPWLRAALMAVRHAPGKSEEFM